MFCKFIVAVSFLYWTSVISTASESKKSLVHKLLCKMEGTIPPPSSPGAEMRGRSGKRTRSSRSCKSPLPPSKRKRSNLQVLQNQVQRCVIFCDRYEYL